MVVAFAGRPTGAARSVDCFEGRDRRLSAVVCECARSNRQETAAAGVHPPPRGEAVVLHRASVSIGQKFLPANQNVVSLFSALQN